jgi:hypothetical protein
VASGKRHPINATPVVDHDRQGIQPLRRAQGRADVAREDARLESNKSWRTHSVVQNLEAYTLSRAEDLTFVTALARAIFC